MLQVTLPGSPALGKPSSLPNGVKPSLTQDKCEGISQELAGLVQKHLELPSAPSPDANLADLGLDSVLAIELASDIKKLYSVTANLYAVDETSTIRDLARLVGTDNGMTLESTTPAVPDQCYDHQHENLRQKHMRVQEDNGIRSSPSAPGLSQRAGLAIETRVWKRVDGLELCADIYYPAQAAAGSKVAPKRPIALLLHGGGHILFTRKEIPMKHVKSLLDRGFLPVSVDFRLCPELNLVQGPMTDAVDALAWARSTLPHLERARPDVQVDGDKVIAVGWSSGGHLAMTLAYAAKAMGVLPPDVVVGFYCASDLEAECWKRPIHFEFVPEPPDAVYDLLEGVSDKPILGHSPDARPGASSISFQDPRSRLLIHYHWKGQMVPILVEGLPSRTKARALQEAGTRDAVDWKALPYPAAEAIHAISPYAQILAGNYRVPTFLVHGDADKQYPWQQSRDTVAALRRARVKAGFASPRGASHAFDFYPARDPMDTTWAATQKAYDFACRCIRL